ncbi:hypothetical protein CDFC105_93934 [Clostridioides difficile]|nr:hypothetical protein CDFC105_93934 [Clostridioides difficile]
MNLNILKEGGTGSKSEDFFFQAEDGIRDFCLSRGLGDVYKRQMFYNTNLIIYNFIIISIVYIIYENIKYNNYNLKAVSYTHLTLPTKRIV